MEWTIRWWHISVQRVYPSSTELAQTYNNAASWWHQHLQRLGYGHAYEQVWRSLKTSQILNTWKDHSSICDCGIGTGAFSLALAKNVNYSVHITGVDLSPEMLQQADDQLNQAHISHHLCQSDVNPLPFADETFDGVISAHMLEHVPHPMQGLKEMARVLRPGAPLVLVVTRSGFLGSLIQ